MRYLDDYECFSSFTNHQQREVQGEVLTSILDVHHKFPSIMYASLDGSRNQYRATELSNSI